MIELQEDGEFTPTIANLIGTMGQSEKFKLYIWVNASELPYEMDNDWDFLFLQESVRVSRCNAFAYIFYDIITGIKLLVLK